MGFKYRWSIVLVGLVMITSCGDSPDLLDSTDSDTAVVNNYTLDPDGTNDVVEKTSLVDHDQVIYSANGVNPFRLTTRRWISSDSSHEDNLSINIINTATDNCPVYDVLSYTRLFDREIALYGTGAVTYELVNDYFRCTTYGIQEDTFVVTIYNKDGSVIGSTELSIMDSADSNYYEQLSDGSFGYVLYPNDAIDLYVTIDNHGYDSASFTITKPESVKSKLIAAHEWDIQ